MMPMRQQDTLLAPAEGPFGAFSNAFTEQNVITFSTQGDFSSFFWMGLIITMCSVCTISAALVLSEYWWCSSQVKMWAKIVGPQKSRPNQCLSKAWLSWLARPSSSHCSISKRLSSAGQEKSSFSLNHHKKVLDKMHHLHIFLSFKVTGYPKCAETSGKSLPTLLPRRQKLIRLELNLKNSFLS